MIHLGCCAGRAGEGGPATDPGLAAATEYGGRRGDGMRSQACLNIRAVPIPSSGSLCARLCARAHGCVHARKCRTTC